MRLTRASGILLHPTSLPGPFGIGDIGPVARRFVDWLAASGQTWWEVLPLGPTGAGNSPFSAYSSFAGNPLLLSPQEMLRDGWLVEEDFLGYPRFGFDRVDFPQVAAWKLTVFRRAEKRFFEQYHEPTARASYFNFVAENTWLRHYAQFMALKHRFRNAPWWEWPEKLRRAEPHAVHGAARELQREIRFQCFLQWQFAVQWERLKTYAGHHGIRFLGNQAYYPAHDSADVWAHQHYFSLNEQTGRAERVAGVPPDFFNPKGQRWGMPVYRWQRIAADGWHYTTRRFLHLLNTVDAVKLDHFIGYHTVWEIPATRPAATHGTWEPGPGASLFRALEKHRKQLPFVTEDLGQVTTEVHKLRDRLNFPGMRVLEFGLESQSDSDYNLPEQYPKHSVAYTGTHDSNTMRGWFTSLTASRASLRQGGRRKRAFTLRYLRTTPDQITAAAIRRLIESPSAVAIIPMQDILDLPGSSRMNIPGKKNGNWAWRLHPHHITDERKDWLKKITTKAQRT